MVASGALWIIYSREGLDYLLLFLSDTGRQLYRQICNKFVFMHEEINSRALAGGLSPVQANKP